MNELKGKIIHLLAHYNNMVYLYGLSSMLHVETYSTMIMMMMMITIRTVIDPLPFQIFFFSFLDTRNKQPERKVKEIKNPDQE